MSDRNGVALHYECIGEGPRLLYCNGSGTTVDSSRPLLDMLSARFELLAFDYRGMGRSAPVTEPCAMATLRRMWRRCLTPWGGTERRWPG